MLEGGRMSVCLEEQGPHAAYFALFFHKDLEILIDDGDGQQDTGARANGSKEVGHYRQTTDTQSTEGSSGGDISETQTREWDEN